MSKAVNRAGAIAGHLKPSDVKAKLEASLDAAIQSSELPQAVVFATNKDGTFYNYRTGHVSKADGARPVKDDDVFQLASQTKLVTSIAALQCVERGLITLDEPVDKWIPELAEQPILEGFDDDDKPILKKRQNKISLRILLTHSTGCAYDGADPLLMQWRDYKEERAAKGATMAERFGYPLLFEPGTRWVYGSSIDWAGLVVMRLTKQTLEEYFIDHIYKPLGIKDLTFWPKKRPELADRLVKISWRNTEGGLDDAQPIDINAGSTDCFGGQGLFGSMSDYVKILHSILKDDGKLLKPETRKMMFEPQLDDAREKALKRVMQGPTGAFFVGEYDLNLRMNWGLGGLLFMEDDKGRRKAGTLQWSGMPNTFWIIDPHAGLALTFGTQVLMPGDKTVAKHISAIERAVYQIAGVSVP